MLLGRSKRSEERREFDSVQLAQLELLEYFCCWEDAGVDDAGDCEGSPDNGADGGEEVVERRPGLVIPHCDGVQVVWK